MTDNKLAANRSDALKLTGPGTATGKPCFSPKRGRPRKEAGNIRPEDFLRAGIIMCIYDEARRDGQKHSVAVTQTVEFIKQRHPEMRISEAGVRRILAAFRSRKNRNTLLFERISMTEGEVEEFRKMSEQVLAVQRQVGSSNIPFPADILSFKPSSLLKNGVLLQL